MQGGTVRGLGERLSGLGEKGADDSEKRPGGRSGRACGGLRKKARLGRGQTQMGALGSLLVRWRPSLGGALPTELAALVLLFSLVVRIAGTMHARIRAAA